MGAGGGVRWWRGRVWRRANKSLMSSTKVDWRIFAIVVLSSSAFFCNLRCKSFVLNQGLGGVKGPSTSRSKSVCSMRLRLHICRRCLRSRVLCVDLRCVIGNSPGLLSLGGPSLPPSERLGSLATFAPISCRICSNVEAKLGRSAPYSCFALVVSSSRVLGGRSFPVGLFGSAPVVGSNVLSDLLPPCSILRALPLQHRSGLRSVRLPRAAPPTCSLPPPDWSS